MSEAGERRQGIQSVGIGLRVLEVLASQNGAAALGAIAQASDLSASQAHRYLASLIAAGMARQDAATGRYELGSGRCVWGWRPCRGWTVSARRRSP